MMFSFLATLLMVQAECQYRQIEIHDFDEATVIHVRTVNQDGRQRFFGYHESGVYPWRVNFEWCGPGWTVEYRLGSECTYWTGEYMTSRKTPDGRAVPCNWSQWQRVPDQVLLPQPKPPEVIRV